MIACGSDCIHDGDCPPPVIGFVQTDGGRVDAGFTGTAGDCVTRAIAIATGKPYREVYDALFDLMRTPCVKQRGSPRKGVPKKVSRRYLGDLGWVWTPTMFIGSGCTVHLRADELPDGRLIVATSRHLVAVIDGVMHDAYDPSRGGTRCVYGYYAQSAVESE